MRVIACARAIDWGFEDAPTLEAVGDGLLAARFYPTVFAYREEATRRGRPSGTRESDSYLPILAGLGNHTAFLCLPHTSPLLAQPGWAELAAQALVIEEPPVTSATVEALINGLMRWAPWYEFARLQGRSRLVASLSARCLEDNWTLPQLVQAFQAGALAGGIDFARNCFDTDLADERDAIAPARAIAPRLERFLATCDDGSLAQLVRLIDDRWYRQGYRPDEILAALHRSAATLLRRSRGVNPIQRTRQRTEAMGASFRVLLTWCVFLLIHEDEAHLNPCLFVDLLGRRFRTLVRGQAPVDEAVLDWGRLAARLVNGGTNDRAALRAARNHLHAALEAALQAQDPPLADRFISQVRAIVTRTWAASEATPEQEELSDEPPEVVDGLPLHQGERASLSSDKADLSYSSFAQVPGSRGAVAQLQSLAAEPKAPAILLEGPPGSGRQAIARLFARAIQCEGAADAPCGLCEGCHRFSPTPDQVNYLECDATENLDETQLRAFIDGAERSLPFIRHPVLIITEAEATVGSLLDSVLKRLEEPGRNVAFVFITADRKRMRYTITSRCTDLTLERLSEADSLAFLHQLAARSNRPLDAGANELIIAAAEGLVGNLQRGYAAAAGTTGGGPLGILEAMHHAWGPGAIADWDAITTGMAPAASLPSATKRANRLRCLLLDVRLRGLESPSLGALAVPALAGSTNEDLMRVIKNLREAAKKLGIAPEDLWSEIARRWSTNIVSEDVGLSVELGETRRLYPTPTL
ncbi:hypothetical protein [Methylobacterium sp. Leaf87]|uniref:hypothetical protein n=1 Tax=Methylobacterium sp. Leaf87 TaxID=1736243 RepID=UPI0009E82A41|nr:hypothetical protein [Methylobacterium sp. Leaf87]